MIAKIKRQVLTKRHILTIKAMAMKLFYSNIEFYIILHPISQFYRNRVYIIYLFIHLILMLTKRSNYDSEHYTTACQISM